jgi:ribosomal protein S18 acetylase RimI-like enzyme
VKVRPATSADLPRVAQLHADRIREGFLSTLGQPFLRRLYRRVLRSDGCFVLVAEQAGEPVAGFVAGVDDLGRLYRRFVLRDGAVAGLRAAPRLLGALTRVRETMAYPAATEGLPDAEILAVAVAADHGGEGVGTALVRAATERFAAAGVSTAKVVTTSDNVAALAMYAAAGFRPAADIEVHEGRSSAVLVWTAT